MSRGFFHEVRPSIGSEPEPGNFVDRRLDGRSVWTSHVAEHRAYALVVPAGMSYLTMPDPLLSHSDLAESNDRRYAIAMSTMEEQVAGSLLRSARLRLGLSQTAFAALLQVAQPTLSAYESGRRQPTLPTLLRMLGRAGLELRLELANRDNHDALLAEWEQTLTRQTRERLRAQGYRLVNDAA